MDRQSLEDELEQLHPQSFGWALRCCFDDREMAAEVLQDTYLKILEGKARYQGQAVFRTWLFSVIRLTAIDHYRRSTRRKRQKAGHERRTEAGTTAMESTSIEAPRQDELFRRGIDQLSPQQSQVLHLVFYQNCTIREAAVIMEVELGTARTHYQRGKQQLKEWLTRAGALKDIY